MQQFLTLIFLSVFTGVLQAQTLTFSGIEKSANSDISELVLREAYGHLDINIEVFRVPGKRALKLSGHGKVDGELFRIGGLSREFPDLIQVPTAINLLEGVYLSKDKTLQIAGWHSLADYKVGVQRGIKFIEKGLGSVKNLRLLTVNKNEQLLMALGKGRIDVAVLARLNALKLVYGQNAGNYRIGEKPLVKHDLFHYLHSKNKKLAPLLDKVLQGMLLTGRIQEIRQDYIRQKIQTP